METMKLPTGVHKSGEDKYRSVLRVESKQYHLGTFKDEDTASRVRVQAKKMTDDLLDRLGKTKFIEVEVEVEVPKYIYVDVPAPPRLSTWRRILERIGM